METSAPSYSNLGGRSVGETAAGLLDVLKSILVSNAGCEAEPLVSMVHEDEGVPLKGKKRTTQRYGGWWCHVETCKEVLKYNEGKVLFAFEHGLQVTLLRRDLTPRDLQECILTAIFLEMLGCDVSFAYLPAISLASLPAATVRQKRLGYLFCSMSLSPRDERFILLVNSIRKDLMSDDTLVVQVALTACNKLLSESSYPVLAEQISRHTNSQDVHVRRKATIALERLYRVAGLSAMCTSLDATKVFENLINDSSSVLCNLSFCKTLAAGDELNHNEALLHILVCTQAMTSGLFSPFAKHTIYVSISLLQLLVTVCGRLPSQHVAPHVPTIAAVLMNFLPTSVADTLHQREMAVIYEVLRTAAHPSLLGFMRQEQYQAFKNICNKAADIMLADSNKNVRYIAIKCVGYISLISSVDGSSRKDHVFKAINSSDASLLLAGVDVLCSIAREHNVTPVLLNLFRFAKHPPEVTNFAVIASLRTALVKRIHQLSWDVARPSSPLLHLTTTLRLFTEFSSVVYGACGGAEQEEEHGLKMLGWLHDELSLQEGEAVLGHGDMELCGASDAESVDEEALNKRKELRAITCDKMSDVLINRARMGQGLVCRFDPVLSRSSEPVLVRIASWVMGEFGVWYGSKALNEVFDLLVDALLDTAAGSGALALTGIVISITKLLTMYTHLRLSGQPAIIGNRDTRLRAESLAAGKGALMEKSKSRDVTVAGAASECLVILQHALKLLAQEATSVEKQKREGTGADLFEELALPYCTCLQQDLDLELRFLDSYVEEQAQLRRSQGWVIRPYVPKGERKPAATATEMKPQVPVVSEEKLVQGLNAPVNTPWGKDGYMGKTEELQIPSSPRQEVEKTETPVLKVPKRKKTQAWLKDAFELAAKDKNKQRKYNQVAKEAGLQGFGFNRRWGMVTSQTTYSNMENGSDEQPDWRQDSTDCTSTEYDADD
eukprot:TRINITY_DN15741_c0_g1_i1.p1 TRINITY_DN15741_c0_g1~~TRINITY_DN15741_c0_g1_i1.p1  ORF type:complete len:950 (+),score=270.39 TRINITY_DN15741_c0_g1_i1:46-2895(+)